MSGRFDKGREYAKTGLLFALMASTVYLTFSTWVYDPQIVPDAMRYTRGVLVETVGKHIFEEAARPVRLAVTLETGRYGVEYDPTALGLLYDKISTTVGVIIGSASQPERVQRTTWRTMLRGKGIYLDYLGKIPLAALARWKGIEPAPLPYAEARRILLSMTEDYVVLYYIDESQGGYFRCVTAVKTVELSRQIGGIEPNGCRFAFETEVLSPRARDETMVFSQTAAFQTRTSIRTAKVETIPLDEPLFRTMLDAFLIRAYGENSYIQTGGTLVAIEGSRSLTMNPDGNLVYYSDLENSASGPLIFAPNTNPTEAEIIEQVRILTAEIAGKSSGDAELYLDSFRFDAESGVYSVRFQYSLGGIPVMLEDGAFAAVFEVQGGYLTYARIHLRQFWFSGSNERLMPIREADLLAAREAGRDYELGLCYRETAGDLQVEWYWQSPKAVLS